MERSNWHIFFKMRCLNSMKWERTGNPSKITSAPTEPCWNCLVIKFFWNEKWKVPGNKSQAGVHRGDCASDFWTRKADLLATWATRQQDAWKWWHFAAVPNLVLLRKQNQKRILRQLHVIKTRANYVEDKSWRFKEKTNRKKFMFHGIWKHCVPGIKDLIEFRKCFLFASCCEHTAMK